MLPACQFVRLPLLPDLFVFFGFHLKCLPENSHPAIVTPEQYDLVQAELERRSKTAGTRQSGLSPYSSKLVCECCGSFFGPKVWHSTSSFRKELWQCNGKYKGAEVCQSRFVTEEEIQQAFICAFNSLISDKAVFIEQHRAIMDELTDTTALERKMAKYTEECEVVAGLIRKAVEEGARAAVDAAEYEARYTALVARYEAAEIKCNAAVQGKRSRELRRVQAAAFFAEVEAREGRLAEFDEQFWNCTIENITVLVDGGFRVRFKDRCERVCT